jgi:hypothetical protein
MSRTAMLQGTASERGLPGVFRRISAFRAAAHLLVWFPLLLAVARSAAGGWRPVSDNAAIALRSWDVLTANAPLVGQATRLATGVYDPGPLQYWLLTLPVHVDPLHGVLWGATLWCMVAASLTIEAAWAAAGRLGGLLATAIVLGAFAWIPAITLVPCWNPWFGLMFLLAAFAAGAATLSGRRGWWPVVVIAGSIAAQAHLMFAITAVALVVLCLAVGLVETYRAKARYTWAVVGFVAALACWSAPFIQQIAAPTGNLTALASGRGAPGPQAGPAFGLKALAASVQPSPFWWRPLTSLVKLSVINERTVLAGAVVLALAVVVLAVAVYPLRSRRAMELAALSLTASATVADTYGHIPTLTIRMTTSGPGDLRYLMAPMYVVGVLAWLTTGTVLMLAGWNAVQQVKSRDQARRNDTSSDAPRVGGAPWAIPAMTVAAVAVIGLAALPATDIASASISQIKAMRAVGIAAQRIERALPHRQLALSVRAATDPERRQVTYGLVYALRTAGYRPEISSRPWALQLGHAYLFRGGPMTHVTVLMRGGGLSVVWRYEGAAERDAAEATSPHRASGTSQPDRV